MSVTNLSPDSIILADGVTGTDGQVLSNDNIAVLSDSNSSSGIIFQENNSILAFNVSNLDIPDQEEITGVTVQCDLVLGSKTTLTLRGTTDAEIEDPANFNGIGSYIGTPANNIELADLGILSRTEINNLKLSLTCSTSSHVISEVRIAVTHGSPPSGVITLTEGVSILKEGVITL